MPEGFEVTDINYVVRGICPECQKKRPSDWLVMLLNEVDEELTRRNVPTRLQVSAYVDCMFPPVE